MSSRWGEGKGVGAVPVRLLADNPALAFRGVIDYISYESKFCLTLWPNILISQLNFNDRNEQ